MVLWWSRGIRAAVCGLRRSTCVPVAAIVVAAAISMVSVASAVAQSCPNEQLRAEQGDQHLPDCRAYELVTPTDKGATQDLFAFGSELDSAIPSNGGERVALSTGAQLGESPGPAENYYVFSRTVSGWQMASVHPATGSADTSYRADIFSSDLSQVGVVSGTSSNAENNSPDETFQVGPPGGPYTTVASTVYSQNGSQDGRLTQLLGASEDFSHVVLGSTDHSLLSATPTGTDEGAFDLYDYANGQLRLVNVTTGGSLVSACGAELGSGISVAGNFAHNAVSTDGSKIFFTSPDSNAASKSEPGCEEPAQLYMRLNDSETVELSAPEPGVVVPSAEQYPVFYEGAAADGSKVFFVTEARLTADDDDVFHEPELYEYNTEAPQGERLTRISRGEPLSPGESRHADGDVEEFVAIAEDGSTIYFAGNGQLTADAPVSTEPKLYRYDTITGTTRYIGPESMGLVTDVSSNGKFFLFPSAKSLAGYSNGGIAQYYRYDDENGSLICVSCSPRDTTAVGATLPRDESVLSTPDLTPGLRAMSEDGRYVFFDTADQLVPQDTNSTSEEGGNVPPGQDVYEWEQDGTGGCVQGEGCLHLISSGTSEAASMFLGASENGENIFFSTHSALVPQDVETMSGNIYDARVNGGFVAPHLAATCVGEGCRLIGSTAPVFGESQSSAFSGAGNLTTSLAPKAAVKPKSLTRAQKLSKALKACKKKPKKKQAECEAQARKKYKAKVTKSSSRGAGRSERVSSHV